MINYWFLGTFGNVDNEQHSFTKIKFFLILTYYVYFANQALF